MRITAGKYKGRKIKTLTSSAVRPTSSKVRESIFNIIQLNSSGTIFYDGETKFLDLFAGSGIMGMESLSRGAQKLTFVEKNSETIKILKQNLTVVSEETQLIHGNALKILYQFKENEFNFIFIDPPYKAGLYEPILEKIYENNILAENGIIILEHDRKLDLTPITAKYNFHTYKTKIYGDTGITIITR